MPADLKARIDAAAASNGRSINAECVARLTESFEIGSSTTGSIDIKALAEALAPRLAAELKRTEE